MKYNKIQIYDKIAAYMNSIMLCAKYYIMSHYEIVLNVKYFAKTNMYRSTFYEFLSMIV